MKITNSRFERAALRPDDEPRAPGPHVVFLGRSNVGKSSLINRLLGTKGLARTSSTPGRTQSINFYRINERCYFVDLPGYGFAKVPLSVRRTWQPMIEGFLERNRERIVLGVMIVDARHEPTDLDRAMHSWLEHRGIPYVVAATKSDKLKLGACRRSARTLTEAFRGPTAVAEAVVVSSETGRGIRELWRYLDHALTA